MTATPMLGVASIFDWWFAPEAGGPGHLRPRWLWLRALGLIFFSAFYSWSFQVRGLMGPHGVLPANAYLKSAAEQFGSRRFYQIPSLLWLASSDGALVLLCVLGLAASVLLVFNLWPRAMMATCVVLYLSFVSAAQDFSSYQSDGMLLAAGFLSLFFAPRGLRPGMGERSRPSRASLFLLQWLWFQIYFESGVVKWGSHDPEWRHLTALDHYYENGPLPDWIGWYAQQLPHAFQAAVALATLIIELGIVWMLFLPRRYRRICFFIVTPFQIGIILTANLAFLNYLVLWLGVLLLDDEILGRFAGWLRWKAKFGPAGKTPSPPAPLPQGGEGSDELKRSVPSSIANVGTPSPPAALPQGGAGSGKSRSVLKHVLSLATPAFFLTWIFYNTAAQLLLMLNPELPLPATPIEALEPFRISERYGLFAVMTTARYEIEFQGSRDGKTWIAYPFRYKPQDPYAPPRVYAPYQPRFDWNLWFASLGGWRENQWVVNTEVRLLQNSRDVLSLFAGDPFGTRPPGQVRAVEWQYWFADLAMKRKTGRWWSRKYIGLYAPTLERQHDGHIEVVQMPEGP